MLGKIFFFGTFTLFKIICPVWLIFKLAFSIVEVFSPCDFPSTMNPEIFFSLFKAQIIKMSAMGALVIQF